MKKILVSLFILAGLQSPCFAQLGRMQYEDAEQAFSEGKYNVAISLLDEAEKSNGKTNPMIEHLRIMAMTDLAKEKQDSELLKTVKRKARAFLKDYSGDTRIEDKYREVYHALKTINELIEAYNKTLTPYSALRIANEEMDYAYMNEHFQFGMTEDGLKSAIPGYLKTHEGKYGYKTVSFNNDQLHIRTNPQTGKAYEYWSDIISTSNNDHTCRDCKKVFDEQSALIGKQWGNPATKENKDDMISYAWKKGTKSIMLQWYCHSISDKKMGSVRIISTDETFKPEQ